MAIPLISNIMSFFQKPDCEQTSPEKTDDELYLQHARDGGLQVPGAHSSHDSHSSSHGSHDSHSSHSSSTKMDDDNGDPMLPPVPHPF